MKQVRYQRAELHNHTTQSDGRLSVAELMRYAAEKEFGVIALTDHNTCSGHAAAERVIAQEQLPLQLIRGVEATTYYGHVLALGTSTPVDLLGLNPQAPETFFSRLRQGGAAAVGIAHPFCLGRPAMAGCRFDMEVHDWDQLDYIEIFNTSPGADAAADRLGGNDRALGLWEDLVLQGHRLAAVTGKDIHAYPSDLPYMVTYALLAEDGGENLADQVIGAILTQRTLVTRGPLFDTAVEDGKLTLYFDHSNSYLNWNCRYREHHPVLWLRGNDGTQLETAIDWTEGRARVAWPKEATAVVLRLYDGNCAWERLLAAGVCVRREEGAVQ